MKEGQIDKRILKTKIAIHDAFKKLIQEKEMSDITISELTKAANVTRSTFYIYYQTVSDVREDIENNIVEKLQEIMSETDLATVFVNPYPFLSMLANQILEYDEKNKYILNEKNSGNLLEKLSNVMVERFVSYLAHSGKGDPAKGKYIVMFFASGIFASFKMWYNHQSSMTLEEVCKRTSNLIRKGLAIASGPLQED